MDKNSQLSERAYRALREAGIETQPEQLRFEVRDELCLIHLTEGRIAWFSTSREATELLARERRILDLVRQRSNVRVPSVAYVSADAAFDIRSAVPGVVDVQLVFEKATRDRDYAKRLGHQLGELLAELHGSLTAQHVQAWLPQTLEWPLARPAVIKNLESVVDDRRLIARANDVLKTYETFRTPPEHRVFVHGDVGFHNLVFDPQNLHLCGIFDFKSAAFADRHLDFRYLMFDLGRFDLLEAACEAYSARTGTSIIRERVLMHNAVWAISFLAYRAGTPPGELSCGRTLDVDLRWTRAAIAQVLDLGICP